MLNPSAMTCRLMRSVIGIVREIRRSIWKNPGRANALRPSVPVQPKNGDGTSGNEKGVPSLPIQRSGGTNAKPLMKGELTDPGGGEFVLINDGRLVAVPKSSFGSEPISTLKGLPDATSTTGETVKFAKNFFQKPESL